MALYWGNWQGFQYPQKKEHLRNTKTAAKGSRIGTITPGPTTMSLILKTRQLLTKAP